MSELAFQHETWAAANRRLWGGAVAPKVTPSRPPRPMSPLASLRLEAEKNARRIEAVARAREAMEALAAVVDVPIVPVIPVWRLIAEEVCIKHGVNMNDLISHRREANIVKARYEAFWRCYRETSMSLPQIGHRFDRDHTTVLHGLRKYRKMLDAIPSKQPESFPP